MLLICYYSYYKPVCEWFRWKTIRLNQWRGTRFLHQKFWKFWSVNDSQLRCHNDYTSSQVYLLMISTHKHKYDDVLQKVYPRIWSGRQRPSLNVLPPTSEKITNHTISMNGRQCIQPIPSKKWPVPPFFTSFIFQSKGNNTLPWEKAIYSEAGAHKFTATAIIFHQIIINPNFLKEAPSDNYWWRTTPHL